MDYQKHRENQIKRLLTKENDDGRFGRIFELECRRKKSRQIGIGDHNQKDVSVKFLVNGKIQYLPAECKTNGGRIDGYFDGSIYGKFTIYRLEFTQKLKIENEYRYIPPIVIPNDLFIALLEDVKAIKAINKNGVLDGYGIQVSSKKLFNRLNDYVNRYGSKVLFDNEKTFDMNDFIDMIL